VIFNRQNRIAFGNRLPKRATKPQVSNSDYPGTYGPSTLPQSSIAGSGKLGEPPIGTPQDKPGSVSPPKTQQFMPRPVQKMKKGGKVTSASSRADGIAQRGKTRGMMK